MTLQFLRVRILGFISPVNWVIAHESMRWTLNLNWNTVISFLCLHSIRFLIDIWVCVCMCIDSRVSLFLYCLNIYKIELVRSPGIFLSRKNYKYERLLIIVATWIILYLIRVLIVFINFFFTWIYIKIILWISENDFWDLFLQLHKFDYIIICQLVKIYLFHYQRYIVTQ